METCKHDIKKKDKAVEKLTKADLKRPDAFITETTKLAEWSFKHKNLMISIVLALVIFGIGWAGWGVYSDARESKAQNLLFSAEKIVKKLETPELPPSPPGIKTPPLPVAKPTEEAYQPALTALKNVVMTEPSTQAGVFAALEFARINNQFKKYGANVEVLEKVKSSGSTPVTRAMVLNALAVAYEGKGDCNKAIEQWTTIESRGDMTFMHGNAYLEKGLCYESLGQKDKAEQVYKKAEGLGKNPEVAKTAKKYLRLMK